MQILIVLMAMIILTIRVASYEIEPIIIGGNDRKCLSCCSSSCCRRTEEQNLNPTIENIEKPQSEKGNGATEE